MFILESKTTIVSGNEISEDAMYFPPGFKDPGKKKKSIGSSVSNITCRFKLSIWYDLSAAFKRSIMWRRCRLFILTKNGSVRIIHTRVAAQRIRTNSADYHNEINIKHTTCSGLMISWFKICVILLISLILTIMISIGICVYCRCRKSSKETEIPKLYIETAKVLLGLEQENYFKSTLFLEKRLPNGHYIKPEDLVDAECQTSV